MAAWFRACAWLAIAGCHQPHDLQFRWDDRRILCSLPVDDVTHAPAWDRADNELAIARDDRSVALVHAHDPGRTVSIAGLEAFFASVDEHALAYVTYPELVAADEPRAAVALAFDDDAIASWHAMRPVFAQYGVRATFFVTRFPWRTDAELAQLAELAADGHAIEAHGVSHLNAATTIAERGLDRYLADEALPSITLLRDAMYPVTSFAYPFGQHDDAADAALLDHVATVRVGPSGCPY